MADATAGRALVLIVGLIISIWLVRGLTWEKDRLLIQVACVLIFMRGIAFVAFDLLGLFP